MKYSQWVGLAAAIAVVFACYLPWVEIEPLSKTLTGMDAQGTNFGRPGKLHIAFCVLTAVFFLLPMVWAKRINWFFCALSLAWALRNFLIYARCEMGTCPERKLGIYLVLFGSALMLVAALFPDLKVKDKKKTAA